MAAIAARDIADGDVVVIRDEGPKGGPGMREMLTRRPCSPARAGTRTSRSSPTAASAAPRAAPPSVTSRPRRHAGGPIAAVRDGDIISIDIPAARSRSTSPEEEVARRRADWQPAPRDGVTG